MSRFCFCNCPAGFSAEPERHAPDCPGRSGAGKTRTPVPAITPALTVKAAEELDAVLHWRGKHTQAIRERDALQRELEQQKRYVEINASSAHGKHMEGLRYRDECDALQQRLTAADERADVLTKALTDVRDALGHEYWDQYAGLDETRDILDAALKPAEGGGDEA